MSVRSFGNPISSFRSRFGQTGSRASRPAGPFSATGGDLANALSPGNGYVYHTFSSSGSLVVQNAYKKTVECLIVAGGGGGGGANNNAGCGGGGGGVAYLTSFPLGTGDVTIPIVIGAGGVGASNANGTVGSGSSITTAQYNVIAVGGGYGGANQGAGGPGGSGGGSGGTGVQPSQNPGNPFVTNYGTTAAGQGGAGAASGGSAPTRAGGIGTSISGFEYNLIMPGPSYTSWPGYTNIVPLPGNNDNEYGGGGQGYSNTAYVIGGGGKSVNPAVGAGSPGIDYLGGGGGAGWLPSSTSGGNGGSGIVVIRYLA